MEEIISKLFSDYLSEQRITREPTYSKYAKEAVLKEKELRETLSEEQTAHFESLLEIISQIHFLEVEDAFSKACKLGARVSKEFFI